MIIEALERLLGEQRTGADIRRIEAGGPVGVLWQQIEAAGFLDLLPGEEQGGAGLPLAELFPILECLGRFVVPVPIAQSIVARALVRGRATLPKGMLTLATRLRRTDGVGMVCQLVLCGAIADHVLVCDSDTLLLLPCATARREAVGDPRSLGATLTWRTSEPLFHLADGGNDLRAFGAAMAAALLSGAMQRSFDMALAHCNTRMQFGKSIGKFQAIQQQLSVMAEHVLAGAIAAESAFQSAGRTPSLLAAAIAKSRASERGRRPGRRHSPCGARRHRHDRRIRPGYPDPPPARMASQLRRRALLEPGYRRAAAGFGVERGRLRANRMKHRRSRRRNCCPLHSFTLAQPLFHQRLSRSFRDAHR